MGRMTNMKQLVISWCNYAWDKSRIFVKSLRKTGYTGDIVFIGGTSDPLTISKYNWYSVGMIVCGNTNESITRTYLSFLLNNIDIYDRVLLSDARDVVFQSNPFDNMDNKLHVVCEDLKIRDQYLNKFWVEQDYGTDIFEKINNDTIICAGTTYGGIILVIEMVIEILVRINKNYQATLNYLCRSGNVNAVIEPNDGNSLVWTIGTKIDTEQDDFYKFREHLVTTLDNVAPPIIHQYDRHSRIKEMLENYYADH